VVREPPPTLPAAAGKGVMKSDGKPRFTTLDGKPIYHFMVGGDARNWGTKGGRAFAEPRR
jgi:hypothetical protein